MSAREGLPDGGSIELVLAEFDGFCPSAVGVLERRLAGVDVTFAVAASARSARGGCVEMFRRAQQHCLAVETGWLRDRA